MGVDEGYGERCDGRLHLVAECRQEMFVHWQMVCPEDDKYVKDRKTCLVYAVAVLDGLPLRLDNVLAIYKKNGRRMKQDDVKSVRVLRTYHEECLCLFKDAHASCHGFKPEFVTVTRHESVSKSLYQDRYCHCKGVFAFVMGSTSL